MTGPRRSGRAYERGFTLIEALVTVAVLTIVSGAMAVAFSVAIKALGSGGAGDRVAGSHDLSAFEQQMSGDVARASCISKSPGSAINSVGACTKLLAGTPAACGASSTSFMCVSWPVWSEGASGVCHTAVYSQSGSVITRVEYDGGTAVNTFHVANDPVTASVVITTTPSPSNPAKNWTSLVTVTLTSLGVPAAKAPQSGNLYLHPLAMDPTTAAVTSVC